MDENQIPGFTHRRCTILKCGTINQVGQPKIHSDYSNQAIGAGYKFRQLLKHMSSGSRIYDLNT